MSHCGCGEAEPTWQRVELSELVVYMDTDGKALAGPQRTMDTLGDADRAGTRLDEHASLENDIVEPVWESGQRLLAVPSINGMVRSAKSSICVDA